MYIHLGDQQAIIQYECSEMVGSCFQHHTQLILVMNANAMSPLQYAYISDL